jgi:hypothetical protein
MSKSNATENDYVKFEANAVAMPSYGATLQINLHIADPTEAGTATSSPPTYTNYVAQVVNRDASGLTICDGTTPYAPNAAGPGYKNTALITFPEYEGGFAGTETITHASVSVIATGQILRSSALDASRIYAAGMTPIFPAGTMIFVED